MTETTKKVRPVTVQFTAQHSTYRVTVDADQAVWEKQCIAKGGKRLVWKEVGTSRWDSHYGFWGGIPWCVSADLKEGVNQIVNEIKTILC